MGRWAGGVIFLCSFFLAVSSFAGVCSCWDDEERREVESFSEIDGLMILSFKDAVSCEPLVGAEVVLSFPGSERRVKTGDLGYVVIPEPMVDAMGEGNLGVRLTADGYIPFSDVLPVEAGTLRHKRFLVSKKMPPESYRFVLQWDESPKDLDLHLIKDTTLHISYRHMRSIPDLARLDRDDRDGFGPETLTLHRVDSQGSYRLFVHNFSGEGTLGSGRVSVYVDNRLDRVIPLPETGARTADILVIERGMIQ